MSIVRNVFLYGMHEMQEHMAVQNVMGETLVMHPEKALFWKEGNALIVSDLHLGKADHFRRNGIPLPSSVMDHNLYRLDRLIQDFNPGRVIFLGDLFHSEYNPSWEKVVTFRSRHSEVAFILVEGNHDLLHASDYARAGIQLAGPVIVESPFIFSHFPLDDIPIGKYCIHGHIHPGAKLRNSSRQSMVIPCFCFAQNAAVLPAFGSFTGLASLQFHEEDDVFGIAEKTVLRLN